MKFVKCNQAFGSGEQIDCELEVIFEADAAIGDDERITKQDHSAATVRIINQQDSRAGR